MPIRRVSTLAALLIFAGAAGAEPPSEPLLAGPSANETTIPGEVRTFTGAARGRFADQSVPHRVFVRAVASLDGEGAPPEIRLTPEQMEKIRGINDEFRRETLSFFAANRDEILDLRARLGLRPEPGRGEDALRRAIEEMRRAAAQPRAQRDAAPGGMMNDDAMTIEALRERMRALFEKAPRQQDAHAKVWALLTEPQRAAASRELERARAELRNATDEMQGRPVDVLNDPRVSEAMKQRIAAMTPEERERALARLRERLANADAPRGGALAGRPIDILNDPRVPEALRQRIAAMTPEDRERALARLRERLNASEPLRRAAEPKRQIPTVETVNVPKPAAEPEGPRR